MLSISCDGNNEKSSCLLPAGKIRAYWINRKIRKLLFFMLLGAIRLLCFLEIDRKQILLLLLIGGVRLPPSLCNKINLIYPA